MKNRERGKERRRREGREEKLPKFVSKRRILQLDFTSVCSSFRQFSFSFISSFPPVLLFIILFSISSSFSSFYLYFLPFPFFVSQALPFCLPLPFIFSFFPAIPPFIFLFVYRVSTLFFSAFSLPFLHFNLFYIFSFHQIGLYSQNVFSVSSSFKSSKAFTRSFNHCFLSFVFSISLYFLYTFLISIFSILLPLLSICSCVKSYSFFSFHSCRSFLCLWHFSISFHLSY